MPRHDFDGAVPDGCYADETPYVDAIQKQAGNIDVEYVRNDECDDFAQLERFFIALDGPVRNPTNFGWMMAILQRARAQGRRVLLSGLYGNYTISWNGWSQAASHLLAWQAAVGLSTVAALLPEHVLILAGSRCENFWSNQ